MGICVADRGGIFVNFAKSLAFFEIFPRKFPTNNSNKQVLMLYYSRKHHNKEYARTASYFLDWKR